MFRHLPEPLDAAVLHFHIWIQAFGDGVTDDRLPLFLQQLNQSPLLTHQTVDLRGFGVEERGDGRFLRGGEELATSSAFNDVDPAFG